MVIKSLVLQLKLMTLVMECIEICARENVPVYCNKATGVDVLKLGTVKNSKPFFS